jgi:hypothetical protein
MADTIFLKRLEALRAKNVDAMFRVQLGDSHSHAHLKGIREGLRLAEEAFTEVYKAEDDGDMKA